MNRGELNERERAQNLNSKSKHSAIEPLPLANTVSKIAVVYGVLWLISFWFQNIIYSTIISGFGVVLLIVVANGLDNLFGENDDNNAKLKAELETLRKEIDELKNGGKAT